MSTPLTPLLSSPLAGSSLRLHSVHSGFEFRTCQIGDTSRRVVSTFGENERRPYLPTRNQVKERVEVLDRSRTTHGRVTVHDFLLPLAVSVPWS